jgi:RimJ/RimL family protein N-acetyltransferase
VIDFGHGVTLSTITPYDDDTLRAWRNDYRVWKWCRQNDLITHQQQAEWFERQHKDPTIKMYLVSNMDAQDVGVAGLTSIDMLNRRAEFSLYIEPSSRGKGHGVSALKTLVSHGMSNLGLNSIWGESFDGNPAMEAFCSLGFIREGVKREAYFRAGRFVDATLFSILFSEWQENPQYNKAQI